MLGRLLDVRLFRRAAHEQPTVVLFGLACVHQAAALHHLQSLHVLYAAPLRVLLRCAREAWSALQVVHQQHATAESTRRRGLMTSLALHAHTPSLALCSLTAFAYDVLVTYVYGRGLFARGFPGLSRELRAALDVFGTPVPFARAPSDMARKVTTALLALLRLDASDAAVLPASYAQDLRANQCVRRVSCPLAARVCSFAQPHSRARARRSPPAACKGCAMCSALEPLLFGDGTRPQLAEAAQRLLDARSSAAPSMGVTLLLTPTPFASFANLPVAIRALAPLMASALRAATALEHGATASALAELEGAFALMCLGALLLPVVASATHVVPPALRALVALDALTAALVLAFMQLERATLADCPAVALFADVVRRAGVKTMPAGASAALEQAIESALVEALAPRDLSAVARVVRESVRTLQAAAHVEPARRQEPLQRRIARAQRDLETALTAAAPLAHAHAALRPELAPLARLSAERHGVARVTQSGAPLRERLVALLGASGAEKTTATSPTLTVLVANHLLPLPTTCTDAAPTPAPACAAVRAFWTSTMSRPALVAQRATLLHGVLQRLAAAGVDCVTARIAAPASNARATQLVRLRDESVVAGLAALHVTVASGTAARLVALALPPPPSSSSSAAIAAPSLAAHFVGARCVVAPLCTVHSLLTAAAG